MELILHVQAGMRLGLAPTVQGALVILAAVFLLSLSDALVKLASDRLALGQLFVLRSAIAALVVAGLIRISVPRSARRWRWGRAVWSRSLCLTGMWTAYYASLPSLSFSLAAAAFYTSPLWMAVLSRVLLRERVGPRRWAAVAIGFGGVLLVLRPDAGTVSPAALLPLLAALLYALAGVITWRWCREEEPLGMALNLNCCLGLAGTGAVLGLALLGLPTGEHLFLLSVWPDLGTKDWMLVGLLGLFMAIIATAVAKAYQLAPAPVVGVFDNAYLVFATLWAVLFFGEIPSVSGGLGVALIGGSAVLASLPQRTSVRPRSRRRGGACETAPLDPDANQDQAAHTNALTVPRA
ncbi:MAG: DMT family transporter [Thalassobaculaceae bacterium]|nr:DMT family transporter [Thalassobaculaceae bacterium]